MSNIVNFSGESSELEQAVGRAEAAINRWNRVATQAQRQTGAVQLISVKDVHRNFRDANGAIDTWIYRTTKAVNANGQLITTVTRRLASNLTGIWEDVGVKIEDDLDKLEREQLKLDKLNFKVGSKRAEDTRYTGATNFTGNLVNQVLPGGLSGATRTSLSAITQVRKNLEGLISTGKVTQAQVTSLFTRIRAGETDFRNLSKGERAAELELRKLNAVVEQFNTLGRRTQDVLLSWRGFLRLLAVQQLHLIISNVTSSLTEAANRAIDFSKGIATIQTISDSAAASTSLWANELTRLSNTFDVQLLDATNAAYEALSNQIGKNIDVIGFMETSLRFAQATTSKAMDATNLLSGSLKGYNLQQIQTDRVAQILFKTIDLGRVRVEQIADTFGNTTPTAKALGISFEELNAALQTLTIKGVRPDTALTSINNILLTLLKPSDEFKQLLKEWGVDSGEAAIATYKFSGVLKLLDKELDKGGLGRIADIAKNMRAIRGEAGLLAGGTFDDFDKNLKETTDDVDAFNKASLIMSENIGTKASKAIQQFNNTLTSTIGARLIQLLGQAYEDLGNSTEDDLKPLLESLANVAALTKEVSVYTVVMLKNFGTLFGVVNEGNNVFKTLIPTLSTFYVGIKLASLTNALVARNFVDVNDAANNTRRSLIQAAFGLQNYQNNANLTVAVNRSLALSYTAIGYAIPLITAGITAAYISYEEYNRKISSIDDETTSSILNANRERLKNIERTLAKELEVITKTIDDELFQFNRLITFLNKRNALDPINLDRLAIEINQIGNNSDGVVNKINSLEQILTKLQDTAKREIGAGNLETAEKIFDKIFDTVKDVNKEIDTFSKRIKDTVKDLEGQKQESLLDAKLFGKNPKQQLKIINEEIVKLSTTLNDLQAKGDIEGALEVATKLRKLIDQSQGIDIKGKNQVNATLEEQVINRQIELNKQLQTQLEAKRIDELAFFDNQLGGFNKIKEAADRTKESIRAVNDQLKEVKDNLAKLQQERKDLEDKLVQDAGNIAGQTAKIGAFLTKPLINTFGTQLDKLQSAAIAGEFTLGGKAYKDIEKEILIKGGLVKNALLKAQTELTDAINTDAGPDVITDKMKNLNKATIEAKRYITDLKTSAGNFDAIKIGADREDLDAIFKQTEDNINAFNELINKRKQVQQDFINAEAFQNQLLQISGQFNAEMDAALRKSPELYKAFSDAASEPIKSMIQLLEDFKANIGTVRQGVLGAQGFSSGGLIGGPLGRDNLLIRAHRNEMVMNDQVTKRFYPMLSAMNAGMHYSNGGSVINVGDVNVNMSVPKGTNINGAEIGKQVRSALRRKITRLT